MSLDLAYGPKLTPSTYCQGGVGAATGHKLERLSVDASQSFKAIRALLGGSCVYTPVPSLQWAHSESLASLTCFTSPSTVLCAGHQLKRQLWIPLK